MFTRTCFTEFKNYCSWDVKSDILLLLEHKSLCQGITHIFEICTLSETVAIIHFDNIRPLH